MNSMSSIVWAAYFVIISRRIPRRDDESFSTETTEILARSAMTFVCASQEDLELINSFFTLLELYCLAQFISISVASNFNSAIVFQNTSFTKNLSKFSLIESTFHPVFLVNMKPSLT